MLLACQSGLETQKHKCRHSEKRYTLRPSERHGSGYTPRAGKRPWGCGTSEAAPRRADLGLEGSGRVGPGERRSTKL